MYVRTLFFLITLLAALPLQAQLREHPATCLTPHLFDLHEHPEKKEMGLRALSAAGLTVAREERQRNVVSAQGHFRVHYDVTGPRAVAARDSDANGIPDYVDSTAFYLEMAWTVEIDQLGYKAPHDMNIQGPEIDAFIDALDSNVSYGYAFPEATVISSDPYRVTGFLVLDNDYKGYATPGIAGLRVTTAHEFHHIVQFSSYRYDLSQAALYEAVATWMEWMVHPSLKDYRNYTDLFLKAPQDYPFSTHRVNDPDSPALGYAHMLYFVYLTEKIGGSIVREIWEEFERDGRSFNAIDEVLRRRSDLNLSKSWCEFALWCYYTGHRAPLDSSYFDEGRSLPTMAASMSRSLDDQDMVVLSGELQPLAFAIDRVTMRGSNPNIRDTIDFLITNARSDIGKGGPHLPADEFTLTVRREPGEGYLPLTHDGGTLAYYKFSAASSDFCVDPILGGVRSVTLAVRTAPQPFINDGSNELVIAVGTPTEQVRDVRVWIYSSAMTRVREITQTSLQSASNLLGVVWNGRDNAGEIVPSGVYIYELSLNGGTPVLGKFAVVAR